MAKNKTSVHWQEDMLIKKGYVKNKDGSFSPPPIKSKYIQSLKEREAVVDQIITTPKQVVVKSPDFVLNKRTESFLTIHGVVAGLNGPDGLMRSHWTGIKKQKEMYGLIIKQQMNEGLIRAHEGAVRIKYIGYKTHFMDWDNFCASFKHIGDSLVKEGVIKEDNPKIVTEFYPQQIKCKRDDQKVIVIIEDIK